MHFFKIILIFFFLIFFQKVSLSKIDVEADHVIVQDYLSGEILYEKEADEKIYPASMTKIMTAIIAF